MHRCFERSEMTALPVFSLMPEILEAFAGNVPVILTAEPGAGKSTAVPLALLDQPWLGPQKILMLEPRRIAAQSVAQRMAFLLGERPGEVVGWRTALDTCVGPKTRLEVVTEGILTRLLQADPGLDGYGVVIFDEYHERTLPADLGLALALDSRRNLRPDLRLALFSATLDSDRAQSFLEESRLIHSKGRTFPVETLYRQPPEQGVNPESTAKNAAWAVREAWKSGLSGDILVFLPGWGEIQRTLSLLQTEVRSNNEILVPLHGSLGPQEQAAALEQGSGRKTVLSSAVAETSLTIPGVTLVIDVGLSRFNRFDPIRAMNRLVTERVCQASADQRRGRAGRLKAGQCWRLWSVTERLDPFLPVEMEREDLTALVLDCLLWGARVPDQLSWMTPPPLPLWNQARELLEKLGAADPGGRITAHGKALASLGIEPRLAHMLLTAPQEQRPLAAACAVLLSERDVIKSQDSDFTLRLEAFLDLKDRPEGRRLKEAWERLLSKLRCPARSLSDFLATGPLLAQAFPDRIGQKQSFEQNQKSGLDETFLMVNGRQVRVRGELARQDYLVAAEADAGERMGYLRLGAGLTKEEAETALQGLSRESTVFTWKGWSVRAEKVRSCGALALARRGVSLESVRDELALALPSQLTIAGWDSLPWVSDGEQLLERIRYWTDNAPAWTEKELGETAGDWLYPFADLKAGVLFSSGALSDALVARLGWAEKERLDREVPPSLQVPSGSRKRLHYQGTENPVLEVRIQEVFGWESTPQICGKPVILHLLSPAQRPLQVTKDLKSFWSTTYIEVRKEMRGRYPKHYWPEDPTQAEPTSRVRPDHRSSKA